MRKKLISLISFFIIICSLVIITIPKISFINETNDEITVEIRGDVIEEKTISLQNGSTFNDVIKLIDLTPTSDIRDYSLNMPLYNNMIINIRSKKNEISLVSIYSATFEELCTLPGIGEKTALKILEYRNINGSFHYLEEIQNVSGIGIKKYEKIKEYITL